MIHHIEHLALEATGSRTHNRNLLVGIHGQYLTGEVLFEGGGLARGHLNGHGGGLGYVALLMNVQQHGKGRRRNERRPK